MNTSSARIGYWNTLYIDKAADHLRRERWRPQDPDLLRHVSPLGWEHIVLSGDYEWDSGATDRTHARRVTVGMDKDPVR